MDAAKIAQLVALLEANPDLKQKLSSIVNIDDAVALVKAKGLEIAAKELQEYISKYLGNAGTATQILGGLKSILGK